MIVLDNQQLLEIFPISTGSFQLNGYVSWMDDSNSGLIANPGGRVFVTSSGPAVAYSVVPLPSGGTIRKVKSLSIFNWGTSPSTFRVYMIDYNKAGAQFDIIRVTLPVYSTLNYGDVSGFQVG